MGDIGARHRYVVWGSVGGQREAEWLPRGSVIRDGMLGRRDGELAGMEGV